MASELASQQARASSISSEFEAQQAAALARPVSTLPKREHMLGSPPHTDGAEELVGNEVGAAELLGKAVGAAEWLGNAVGAAELLGNAVDDSWNVIFLTLESARSAS